MAELWARAGVSADAGVTAHRLHDPFARGGAGGLLDALAAAERERDEACKRLDSQADYSIHLQRLIEACAHGYPLRDDSIAGAPFHGEKARVIAANIVALRAQVATLREALEAIRRLVRRNGESMTAHILRMKSIAEIAQLDTAPATDANHGRTE